MAEKIYTYVMITVGLMVLFNLAGLYTNTGYVLGQLGITPNNIQNFESSTLWITLIGLAIGALAGIGGIVISVFTRVSPELPITALFTGVLTAFVGDLLGIISYSQQAGNFVGLLVFLIMSPLIIGYVIALYDWVRGRD